MLVAVLPMISTSTGPPPGETIRALSASLPITSRLTDSALLVAAAIDARIISIKAILIVLNLSPPIIRLIKRIRNRKTF